MADDTGWHPVNPEEFWSGETTSYLQDGGASVIGTYPGSQETTEVMSIGGGETTVIRSEMYAMLVQMNGARKDEVFKIRGFGAAVIGRKEGSILLDDTTVSGSHARLKAVRAEDGALVAVEIHDLESENGTWVNGKLVEKAELKDRDRIRLGETELLFVRI